MNELNRFRDLLRIAMSELSADAPPEVLVNAIAQTEEVTAQLREWLKRHVDYDGGRGPFAITNAQAAAIRLAFEREGELSAVVELRRLLPGLTDNAHALTLVRTIAGW